MCSTLRSPHIGDLASSKSQIDFASIGRIQDLCKSKLYPTTGRLVKGTATWYARSSKTRGRSWCKHDVGKSTNYEIWCVCQIETTGEVKGLKDMTVQ